MGQGLQHGDSGHMVDSGSHIGLVVHNGSHLLDNGHNGGGSHMVDNGSHMLDHRNNGSHSLDNGNGRNHMLDHRNHWSHSLDHRNGRNHMLHHRSEHSLVVELGEALVGSGHGSRVHHSAQLGHNGGSHGHMVLLNESRSGGSNGGQGTDGNLLNDIGIIRIPDPPDGTHEAEHVEVGGFWCFEVDEVTDADSESRPRLYMAKTIDCPSAKNN
ncbi:hypothetical protein KR054_009305 [Drosophila jambulina]|nr:hypothetical protein KR054_009305 [Drosophila jambulina]